MAVTKNESFGSVAFAGTSVTYNVATNFTAGRDAIVLLSYYQYGSAPTVAVSIGGDTATLAVEGGGPSNSDRRLAQIWYKKGLTGGSTAVAITGLIASDGLAVTVIEIDDGMLVSPVDVTSASTTAVASPLTRTTADTAQAIELVVCVATADGFAATGIAAPTSGYTTGQVYDPNPLNNCAASSTGYKYTSSVAAQSATWTTSSGTLVGAVAAFTVNSGGSTAVKSRHYASMRS